MKREDFDHVVRAAAEVVQDDLVVIGSQAVLGQHPNAPESLLTSLEVDLYPLTDPGRADLIDGALGDGSPFHETYGYYAQGVGPETAKAPAGLAKLAAGRPHDIEYAIEALRAGLVDPEQLRLGVALVPASHRNRVGKRLDGVLRQLALS